MDIPFVTTVSDLIFDLQWCGVMKDEDLKTEEIEVSHTPGGSGEVDRGDGRRESVDDTVLEYTLKYINLTDSVIMCQVRLR